MAWGLLSLLPQRLWVITLLLQGEISRESTSAKWTGAIIILLISAVFKNFFKTFY
jgi:hypothetical protein